MRLKDRVAIVTGGGRAIGKAISLRLVREGAAVALIGLDETVLGVTSKEIATLGGRSLARVTDVSDESQVSSMAEAVLREFGRIDILVNNAGVIGPTAPVTKIRRADWDEVMAVNLTGPFLCSRAVLPAMIERRSGRIINISSIAGKKAYALRSPYAVSKWGLIGLTRTLAQEVGEYNIQVNAICPGPVEGERLRHIIERRAQELGQTIAEVEWSYVGSTALKRMVEPDEVASMVAFLASDEANNITGQAIDVTAGYGL